jgi:hypothetical protein
MPQTLTPDTLRREGEALMEDVSRELYEAYAGLKPAAELRPIYERHRAALTPDALDLALDAWRATDGAGGSEPEGEGGDASEAEERRSARGLAEWQVETQASRALAEHDEREIAWERAAIVRLPDGRTFEYGRIPIEIANATDRRERLLMDEARAALVGAELGPLRQERFERERDFVDALGLGPYVDAFARLSGVDVDALATSCEQLLRDTQAMWDDVLPDYSRRRLAIPARELTRADALALFRAPEFDPAFPAGGMLATIRTQVTSMGVDPEAVGRVRYDVGERPGKRARAFCAPVRVPHEVYLVLRPHGGAGDWRTLLHELGHALHFANARPDLPFEARWAGDNSVTEGFAMLFDHLMHDRGWLTRYTELGKARVGDYLRSAGLEELHFLRRYAGKLRYELALYRGEVPWRSLPDLYVETLGAATGFQYRAADAFVDVDPRFYSTRYLRAWQLQAVITEALRERYDADWWRNPRAGPWLVGQLLAEGQRELADELAARVAGRPLSFAPVVRAVEAMLA